ncbi:NPCBM/NEW2 domain-containing protein [Crossiella sp. SN42]|nr:NPCBM/NEW2 domain-containing protein [Crossiella sp. SN42]
MGATGARTLTLRVTDGGDGRNFDHADWAEARLPC